VAVPSFLARDRIVARPGFNRWLIPPAALAVHLCIGQAYATSVYKTALVEHFDTSLTAIGIIFSIAIVMLGVSAALFGTWVDRNGPRAAMFTSAVFWVSGFLVGGWASRPASCGCSTSATASWAASAWASATSRRSPH
jgi:MFS family permease